MKKNIITSRVLKTIGIVKKAGKQSQVNIFSKFCDGLQRLNRFSHIIVLYWLHKRDNEKERETLKVIPRRHPGAPEVGVFASRSPSRPNPIALCVVELIHMDKCSLFVKGLDAVEGSPIIDIKPYIPRADSVSYAQTPCWTQSGPKT
jgi:tRNA-Thr(GGU) m(6)t(6)A37 methyltransferase TsaA